MKFEETRKKVHEKVDNLIEAQQVIHPDDVTWEILLEHEHELAVPLQPSEFESDDFVPEWAYLGLRKIVRDTVNQRQREDRHMDPAQHLTADLEFEHLQDYYTVKRQDDQVYVPLEAMTDEEIKEKAEEKYKMARANQDHADELMEYLRHRQGDRPA